MKIFVSRKKFTSEIFLKSPRLYKEIYSNCTKSKYKKLIKIKEAVSEIFNDRNNRIILVEKGFCRKK